MGIQHLCIECRNPFPGTCFDIRIRTSIIFSVGDRGFKFASVGRTILKDYVDIWHRAQRDFSSKKENMTTHISTANCSSTGTGMEAILVASSDGKASRHIR